LRLTKILSSPVHFDAPDVSWYCSETPPSWCEMTVSVPWHGVPGFESVPAVAPTRVRLIVIFTGNVSVLPTTWTVPFHLPFTLLAAWAGEASPRVARRAMATMRAWSMPALIPAFPARQACSDELADLLLERGDVLGGEALGGLAVAGEDRRQHRALLLHHVLETMLLVTHELPFAREVSDWVVFIDRGKVVEEGPPADVLDHPSQERTQAYVRTYASTQGAGLSAVGVAR
jgi:hypothetical protein